MLQKAESLYVQLTLHAVHVTTLTTECLRQHMQNYSRFVFLYLHIDVIFKGKINMAYNIMKICKAPFNYISKLSYSTESSVYDNHSQL